MQPTLSDAALRILSTTAVAFGIVPGTAGGTGSAASPPIGAADAARWDGKREDRVGEVLVMHIRRRRRRDACIVSASAVGPRTAPEAAVGHG
jgi:hypothetical protein